VELACQEEFFVNNPLDVKEDDEHAPDVALHLSRLLRSRQICTFPLGGFLLCLRIITINLVLITGDNPGQEGSDICTELEAHLLFLCRIHCKIISGQIHDSKQKDVKNQHIKPDA
jgi:hypothetical protein